MKVSQELGIGEVELWECQKIDIPDVDLEKQQHQLHREA